MKIALAAGVGLVVLGFGLGVAGSCAAQQAVPGREITRFSRCDGYGEPSSSADGMTKEANLLDGKFWSTSGGNTSKEGATVGAEGVASCDVALTDPALKPEYWMRRVSLYRAKAIHQMAASDLKGAQQSLEQAQAAVQDANDPFYRRSLGLGLQLVRAYAMRRDGRAAEAERLAMTDWRPRRFDRQACIAALMALGSDADPKNLHEVRLALAQVYPSASLVLYEEALTAGDFAQVVRLYPQLTPPSEYDPNAKSDDERRLQDARNGVKAAMFWAEQAGPYAYALAATGQGERARQAFVDAKARLAKAAEVPPAPVPNAKGKIKPDPVYNLMASQGPMLVPFGTAAMDRWQTMVDWRLAVDAGRGAEVTAQLKAGKKMLFSPASVELLTAIAAHAPSESRSVEISVAHLKAELKAHDQPVPIEELGLLFKALPDAETRKRAPTMGDRTQSAKERKGDEPGAPKHPYIEVKAFDWKASPAMLDELALADAADYARRNGKPGFLVLARHNHQVVMETTLHGQVISTKAAERWVEYDIVPVDPANLPPEFAGGAWRVLKDDDVLAQLMPVYAPASAGGAKSGG